MTRAQGYALVIGAASLWGLTGPISKVVLTDGGLTTGQLTQARVTGAFIGLLAALAITNPGSLRASRRELGVLAALGVIGLNGVQVFYFKAIVSLPVGIAVLIEYLAPVLVALYAWLVLRQPAGRRLWSAIGLVVAGLALMVELFSGGGGLDSAGVVYALLAAVTYAFYVLVVEGRMGRRPPVATLCLGFGFATAFWLVVEPPWSFPWHALTEPVDLGGRLAGTEVAVGLCVFWIVVLGTLVPFAMLVSALHALPAARVTLLSTWEPVAGAIVAWIWLEERLTGPQIAGAALVLAGIVIAETAPSLRNSH